MSRVWKVHTVHARSKTVGRWWFQVVFHRGRRYGWRAQIIRPALFLDLGWVGLIITRMNDVLAAAKTREPA